VGKDIISIKKTKIFRLNLEQESAPIIDMAFSVMIVFVILFVLNIGQEQKEFQSPEVDLIKNRDEKINSYENTKETNLTITRDNKIFIEKDEIKIDDIDARLSGINKISIRSDSLVTSGFLQSVILRISSNQNISYSWVYEK
jgi:biopolymer transport protein ExbD